MPAANYNTIKNETIEIKKNKLIQYLRKKNNNAL